MGDGFLMGVRVGVGVRVLSFAMMVEGGDVVVWSGSEIVWSRIILVIVSVSETECLFVSAGFGCMGLCVRGIELISFSAVG